VKLKLNVTRRWKAEMRRVVMTMLHYSQMKIDLMLALVLRFVVL
jgi:hypothetical protein